MIETVLLGSGGTLPKGNRPLTSLYAKIQDLGILVDCGEGTQVAVSAVGKKVFTIDLICITHRHADHVLGLPGILVTMNQVLTDCKRYKDLLIVAPADAMEVICLLVKSVTTNRLNIGFLWLEDDEETVQFGAFRLQAIKLRHSVSCYGYAFYERNVGHFNMGRAQSIGLRKEQWSLLQAGYRILSDGELFDLHSVSDVTDNGVKVCYATDTDVCNGLYTLAKDANLAILEGMYYQERQKGTYANLQHMTYQDAATIARDCGANELWLTHFSPTIVRPTAGIHEAEKIFRNVKCGKQGLSMEVGFAKSKGKSQCGKKTCVGARRNIHA